MPADKTSRAMHRGWTADQESGPPRRTMILFLLVALAVALGWYGWMLWPRSRPQIYFASLHVADYDDAQGLPDPVFAEHDVSALNAVLAKHDFVDWSPVQALRSATLQDANSIANATAQLVRSLKEQRVSRLDTVVVQLRGNCLDFGGKAWFLAGEFDARSLLAESSGQASAPLETAIELEQLIESIRAIPAGNIVVLADLCDLSSSPRMGLLANPVATRIEAICAAADPGDSRIWILTGGASLQPAHHSRLRGRTLLQAACEFALNPEHRPAGADPGRIGLDAFYASILRYSVAATRPDPNSENPLAGLQTPLLFRHGHSGPLSDRSGDSWSDASRVALANRMLRPPPKDPVDGTAGSGTVAAGSSAGGESGGKPAGESALPATGAGAATAAAPPPSPPPPSEPADPALRFWKLAATLESRTIDGKSDCFSPVDFAPARWLELLSEVTRLERQRRIPLQAAAGEAALVLRLNELTELQAAIRSEQPVAAAASPLATAWNDFLPSLNSPESGRIGWRSPEKMPAGQAAEWLPMRARYRRFLDSASQIQPLLNAELDGSVSADTCQQLIASLAGLQLPDGDESLLGKGSAGRSFLADTRAMDQAVAEARAGLARQAVQCLSRINASGRISWSDERTATILLQNPLLDFAARRQLFERLNLLTAADIVEPGVNNVAFGMERAPAELLAGVVNSEPPSSGLAHLQRWATHFDAARQLAGGEAAVAGPQPGTTAESLNAWCRAAAGKPVPAAAAGSSGAARGFLAECVGVILNPGTAATTPGKMLLPRVSADLSLYLESPVREWQLPGSSLEQNELVLRLKRGDGGPPGRCFASWRIAGGGGPDTSRAEWENQLSVRMNQTDIWAGGWTDPGDLSKGEIILRIQTAVDSRKTARIPLEILLAADRDGRLIAEPLRLEVLPPRPDRVSLVIQQVNPADGRQEPLPVRSPSESDPPAVLQAWPKDGEGRPLEISGPLTVPAVGDFARSEFAFWLVNESLQEKLVRLKVYEADAPLDPLVAHRGQVHGGSWLETDDRLIFQSVAPLQLAGGARGNVKLELFSPPVSDAASPRRNRSGQGVFGLVCLVEELEAVEASFRPTGKRHVSAIEWNGENPYWNNLVRIDPRAGNGDMRLVLSVAPGLWQRYRMQMLPVEAIMTDANGGEVETLPGLELNPAQSQQELRLQTRSGSGKRFAHLSLGGFPRAIAFSSALEENETAQPTEKPFAWMDLASTAMLEGGEPVNPGPPLFESARNRIVIPFRTGVGGNPRELGDPSRVSALAVPVRVDLPRDRGTAAVVWKKTDSRESQRREFSFDRVLDPVWQVDRDSGNLLFGATASDFTHSVTGLADLSGEYQLDVSASQGGIEQTVSGLVVLDHAPPARSRIRVALRNGETLKPGDTRMYSDDELTIEFVPEDAQELSPITAVWFSLTQGSSEDYADGQPLPAGLPVSQTADGVWRVLLGGDVMIGRAPGLWTVLARSRDAAGNRQDRNIPATVQWMGRRPKDAPAPDRIP